MEELFIAVSRGDLSTLNRLIENGIDPSVKNNHAIQNAAYQNQMEIVKRLLHDRRVDPSVDNNSVLIWASHYGNLSTVELLLLDPRVDTRSQGDACIEVAANNKHWDIAETLLSDPRSHTLHNIIYVMQRAIDDQQNDLVNRIFAKPSGYFIVDTDIQFTHIRMIRSRCMDICIVLQDLELPAYITLKIIDALIPNTITMYKKWELITLIKHFIRRTT